MEEMCNNLAELSLQHGVKEDIKIDNGALLLYAIDQYFTK